MTGFTSIFGSSGSSKDASAPALSTSTTHASAGDVKKQIQDQIAQELAITNATELVNKITENCFEKCIPVPGTSISPAEQDCTRKCMEKYMHAWNIISRSYISRIQQASASGQI
ncbi:mitochondrial import inner membrane translocase subunit Tim13p [Trichomonascus vanleenenianus]|uniref:protein translocase subunit TIM13 n=1 Tax=Trichomonascus vanleenenianus TaxID=2268995 RepID=UPI003ECB253A